MKWAALVLATAALISGTIIGLRATDDSGSSKRRTPIQQVGPGTLPEDWGQTP